MYKCVDHSCMNFFIVLTACSRALRMKLTHSALVFVLGKPLRVFVLSGLEKDIHCGFEGVAANVGLTNLHNKSANPLPQKASLTLSSQLLPRPAPAHSPSPNPRKKEKETTYRSLL